MSKVLLIAPSFFGYRDSVADVLRSQGEEVTVVNDRPSEGFLFKAAGKINYNLAERKIDAYSQDLARLVGKGVFARLIYMGGMSFCFSRKQMERIRSASDACFVAYLWDSLRNYQRFGGAIDCFDDIVSFDPGDCVHRITLRPLFYRNALAEVSRVPEGGFEYDACFVGTVHQISKFKSVLRICETLEAEGRRVFKYFYVPGRSVALFRSFSERAYWRGDLKFKPLPPEELGDIYRKSKAIIDAPQMGQRGLTMRAIESVGLKRKLITTNRDVLNYDFAQEGRVLVFDDSKKVPRGFFDTPYLGLPPTVYESYSIDVFAKTLMGRASAYEGYRYEGI